MFKAKTPARILLVDDEPQILRALQRLLKLAGHQVVSFDKAAMALEHLASHQSSEAQAVQVVISDMRMPEMTGPEFLKVAAEQQPHTRRIVLTGTAKPTPVFSPVVLAMAVFIPIKLPLESSKGPPEFPGLIAVRYDTNCINFMR